MKNTDLAYMAGFFDGEGSVGIYVKSYAKNQYYMKCSLTQAGEFLPNLMKFHFGGRTYSAGRREIRYKDQWEWKIYGHQAKEFLKAIVPYLKIKRAEAELAIEFQGSMSRRKGLPHLLGDEELAVREAQRILMANLKK